jgi:glycosyltransferase involved in cell wall biosynthesis
VIRHGYFPEDPRVRRAVGTLLDEGYEVDVICLRDDSGADGGTWRGARIHRLPGRRVRRGAARYAWEYASFFALAFLQVTRLHATRRYDVVQVHTLPDALVFAALVPKLAGAKVILDMHELMPEFAATKFRLPPSALPVRAIARVERWSARFADRVLGVSTAQASIIEPRVGRRLHLVPNVPDEALLRGAPGEPSRTDGQVVITHGTMTEGYGVQLLLEALPIVLADRPVTALLVGDGEYLPELRRRATELGLSEHVVFTGRVPPAELARHIASATVGVITLRKDGYGELCVPNKVFDYAALGVPVVAPDLWAMRSYFGSDGLVYFQEGDHADLARAIVRALDDELLRSNVAERARAVYEDVRWEKTSRTYLDVVRELVGERPRSLPGRDQS